MYIFIYIHVKISSCFRIIDKKCRIIDIVAFIVYYILCCLYSLCSFVVLKIALIQLAVGPNKIENISKATQLVATTVKGGASIVSLPVCVLYTS